MTVFPNLPENPYDTTQLLLLYEKFKQVTDKTPKQYINKVIKILEKYFSDEQILDYDMINFVLDSFSQSNKMNNNSEIFKYSILHEIMRSCLYHPVFVLKQHLGFLNY